MSLFQPEVTTICQQYWRRRHAECCKGCPLMSTCHRACVKTPEAIRQWIEDMNAAAKELTRLCYTGDPLVDTNQQPTGTDTDNRRQR